MKLIIWSAKNKKKSLAIMIALHFFIGSYLIWFGNWLIANDIIIPEYVISIIISAFLIILVIYPIKKFNFTLNSIIKRKILDFIIALMSFTVMVYIGNNIGNINFLQQSNISKVFSSDTNTGKRNYNFKMQEIELKNEALSTKILEKNKRHNRADYRYVKQFKKSLKLNKLSIKGKILIILTIIGSLGATFLLAGLACQISCNGAGVLAIIVFIAGFSAILALSIHIIKRIIIKHKKVIINEQKGSLK